MRQNHTAESEYNHFRKGGADLKTVIYADVLVFINIILNYFLLRIAAKITSSECRALRFLLASLLGGAYSLIIFVDGVPDWLMLIINLVFSALMVAAAFEIRSLKSFLKKFAAFFLSHTAFAGVMLLLCTFVFGDSAVYRNGAVYFDVDILTLTVSAVVCYAVLSVVSRFTKNRPPDECVYSAELSLNGKSVDVKALFDTGNALTDSFSGRPVVICEMVYADKLLPDEIRDENGNPDLTKMKGFRLIPYSTVSGAGALPAFPLDRIKISGKDKTGSTEKLFVAVTEKKLVSGDYSALFGMPAYEAVVWRKYERGNHFEEIHPKTERKNIPFDFKGFQHGSKLHKRSGNASAAVDGRKGVGMPSAARRR